MEARVELEIVHTIVFFVLSILFLVCAIVIALKERSVNKKRLKPNHVYLKMRHESANYFNEMVRGLSRFEHLQILISESITTELVGNIVQTDQEAKVNKTKRCLLEEDCGNVFLEIIKRFADISWQKRQQARIKKAILFEANRRFIEHPYDLRGLRHAKIFQDTLNEFLTKTENPKEEKESLSFTCLGKITRIFNPTRILVSCTLVVIVVTATIGVNLFDYFTDYTVIQIFWKIANTAKDFRNGTRELLIIPLLYSGPSFFLICVFSLSVFISMFHVRTIFYFLQVKKD